MNPDEIEAAARAEEAARKQQPGGSVIPDVSGALDGLLAAGEAVVTVAEGAANVVGEVFGAVGSVFEGF